LEQILPRWILTRRKLKRSLLAASTAQFFFKKDVLIFERSREIDRKKNRPTSYRTGFMTIKVESGLFSTLFACANEATVRKVGNYMNNKTSGKYHASLTSSFSKTKVSFVLCSTKDL